MCQNPDSVYAAQVLHYTRLGLCIFGVYFAKQYDDDVGVLERNLVRWTYPLHTIVLVPSLHLLIRIGVISIFPRGADSFIYIHIFIYIYIFVYIYIHICVIYIYIYIYMNI